MLGFVADAVDGTGCGSAVRCRGHERSAGRVNHRNGYRPSRWETRAGTVDVVRSRNCARGRFPGVSGTTPGLGESNDRGDGRKPTFRAFRDQSDDAGQDLGMTARSPQSQVSRLCVEIDELALSLQGAATGGRMALSLAGRHLHQGAAFGTGVSVAAIVAVAVSRRAARGLGIAIQPSEAEVFWDEIPSRYRRSCGDARGKADHR